MAFWEVKSSYRAPEHITGIFIHGAFYRQCLWRLGSPIPPVTCPSGRLVVSGSVRRALGSDGERASRLRLLCIVEPQEDWTTWSNWNREAKRLKRKCNVDEYEQLVVPYEHFGVGIGARQLPESAWRDLREAAWRDLRVIRDPDLYAWGLEQEAGGASLGGLVQECGVRQIHNLQAGHVEVNETVRGLLEEHAWPDTIGFSR